MRNCNIISALQGLLNLTACAPSVPTSDLIVFSSTAAVLGPSGQANYAAANAAVNALVSARQAAGNVGTAIMWGAWTIGMAAQNQAILARLERYGMGSIAPEAGLVALEAIIGTSQPLPQVPDQGMKVTLILPIFNFIIDNIHHTAI